MDDITLIGPPDQQLIECFKKLQSEALKGGLEINLSKTKFLWFHNENIKDIMSPDIFEYLQSQRDIFHTYRRLMTSNQWLLLRGIARERGAKLVMGGEFVRKYGLGSPSSVQTALDALYDKELIYEEDGRLFSEDVALSRWLELT